MYIVPPADGRAVLAECARIVATAADGGEPLVLWRRCMAVVERVIPPADGRAVLTERAGVE